MKLMACCAIFAAGVSISSNLEVWLADPTAASTVLSALTHIALIVSSLFEFVRGKLDL